MKRIAILVITLFVLSGCHEGVFHWITPEPESVVVVTPEVVPEEETGEAVQEPAPQPPCEQIKGNISTSTGEKIYHVPGGANYNQVKIDESAGETWFCSEEDAVEAGWRKASR